MSTTDKILRWVVLIGIFIIPLAIPFFVSSTMFFPFITGKNFAFRIIVEIIFAAWLLLALRHKEFRPKFSWIASAVAAFIVILFAADLLAENPHKAFWSNYERMEGFVSLFHLALYFLVAGSTLIAENLWLYFWRAIAVASIGHGVYGVLQLMGKIVINQGGVRVDGTFGNAAYFGGFLMMMIFLALFLIARDKNLWWRIVYGVAAILDFIILYSTATRGALLGLIGGLMLTAILIAIFGKETPRLRKIAIGVAVAVVVISSLFYGLRNSTFVQNNSTLARLTSISVSSGDAQARFMVWGMAWQGIKERPILGWGQEGFNFVFNKYYNPGMYLREQWFDRTHDIIFDWLIAAGILGFLGYLSLLISAVLYIWDKAPAFIRKKMGKTEVSFTVVEKSLLTGFLAAYFFQNLFVFDNIVSYIIFFSFLAYLHFRLAKPIAKINDIQPVTNVDAARFYAPILIVVVIVAVWFVNVRSILASVDLINALRSQSGGVMKNFDYFKMAIAEGGFADQEIREQLVQAAANVNVSDTAPQDVKVAFASLAASEMEKQVKETPTDARIRVFLGSFYSIINNLPAAIAEMEEALKLSPQKQVIKSSLANMYLRAQNVQKAEALMKSAYESAPQFNDVAVGYIVAAIYASDAKTADGLAAKLTDEGPIDRRVLQAYFDRSQASKGIAVAKMAYDKHPGNVEAAVTLAAAYLQTGAKSAAIAVIRDAISKNPDFKDIGEQYINQIQTGKTQ